jgi:hypothetical protein
MQANGQFLTHDYGPWITITFDACFLTEDITLMLFGPYGKKYYEVEPYTTRQSSKLSCAIIGVTDANSTKFEAINYKISAPVTYFQGNQDGATAATGAIKHYKNVPQGKKQLLIAVNGGHCPGYSSVTSSHYYAKKVLEAAFLGEKISEDQIKSLNESQNEVRWKFTNQF